MGNKLPINCTDGLTIVTLRLYREVAGFVLHERITALSKLLNVFGIKYNIHNKTQMWRKLHQIEEKIGNHIQKEVGNAILFDWVRREAIRGLTPIGMELLRLAEGVLAFVHQHEQLAGEESGETDPTVPETPLSRSQAAYQAELPELLESDRGKWVAYADGKRVRIANTQAELYRHCLKDLGLTHDRFVVRRIIPDGGSQIEFTLR